MEVHARELLIHRLEDRVAKAETEMASHPRWAALVVRRAERWLDRLAPKTPPTPTSATKAQVTAGPLPEASGASAGPVKTGNPPSNQLRGTTTDAPAGPAQVGNSSPNQPRVTLTTTTSGARPLNGSVSETMRAPAPWWVISGVEQNLETSWIQKNPSVKPPDPSRIFDLWQSGGDWLNPASYPPINPASLYPQVFAGLLPDMEGNNDNTFNAPSGDSGATPITINWDLSQAPDASVTGQTASTLTVFWTIPSSGSDQVETITASVTFSDQTQKMESFTVNVVGPNDPAWQAANALQQQQLADAKVGSAWISYISTTS